MLYYKKFIENKKVGVVKLFTLVVSLVFFQTSAMAEQCTKYVSNLSSANSSSSSSEGVAEYSNINAALEDRVTGDVICFKAGVYPAIRLIDIDGGDNKLTLQAEQGSSVEITNTDYRGIGIYLVNSKNIVLSGFTVSGGLFGIYAKGSSDLTVSNNHIFDVGQEGIVIKSSIATQSLNNFVVSNNIIADTGKGLSQYGEGIYIGDGNDNFNEILHNVVIENNHITNVTNEAIDIKINVENIRISSNTIIDTNLKFNGAITVATSDRYNDDSDILIDSNIIRGVTNRMGYRAIAIALGQGDATITNNFISEPGVIFAGICLFTTFVNSNANTVTITDNEIVTNGIQIVESCGSGGTGANAPANVNYLQ